MPRRDKRTLEQLQRQQRRELEDKHAAVILGELDKIAHGVRTYAQIQEEIAQDPSPFLSNTRISPMIEAYLRTGLTVEEAKQEILRLVALA